MFKRYLLLITALLCFCQMQAQTPTRIDPVTHSATDFIQSLTPGQQPLTLFPFKDPDRYNWSNEPENMHPRKGLQLSAMTDKQKLLLHKMLQAILSEQGYLKVANVIRLDEWLKQNYYKQPAAKYYGEALYRIAFFGTPDDHKPWGWRFEGHHLSINVTWKNNQISVTPFFIGSHPAIMPTGPLAGLENLFSETELAHQLINSFTPQQLQKAVISKAEPKAADILIRTGKEPVLKSKEGILVSGLNPYQQQITKKLINSYVDNLAPALAKHYSTLIERKVWQHLRFIWMGSTKSGEPAYYRFQSPDGFVIEYCSRLHEVNHIHTLWQFIPTNFGGI